MENATLKWKVAYPKKAKFVQGTVLSFFSY